MVDAFFWLKRNLDRALVEFLGKDFNIRCPSCKALKPRLKEASKAFEDRIYVYEMDITTTKRWEDLNVMSVPTLLYFRGGREMGRQVAFTEKADMERKIMETLQM